MKKDKKEKLTLNMADLKGQQLDAASGGILAYATYSYASSYSYGGSLVSAGFLGRGGIGPRGSEP